MMYFKTPHEYQITSNGNEVLITDASIEDDGILLLGTAEVYDSSKVMIIGLWMEHLIQFLHSFSNCIRYMVCVMKGM